MTTKRKKNGPVVIIGAGGHGKVLLDILLESKTTVLGFIDDNPAKAGQNVLGFPILGGWDCLKGRRIAGITLGIGNNRLRFSAYEKAKSLDFNILSAIHPKAAVSRSAKIGEGVVVMAGAAVNPGAILEDGVCVNTGATVDHDCRLGRFCQIWPGAHMAGSVRVGEFSYVGTGAAVIPNVSIGRDVLIGAGAAVISDIPDSVVAVGVPAKPVKKYSGV